MSPSRGRLDPEISLRAPSTAAPSGFLVGKPSFEPDFPFSCFRLVLAVALSSMVCERVFTSGVPFFTNLGSNFATFVFWRTSSSTVMNRASNWKLWSENSHRTSNRRGVRYIMFTFRIFRVKVPSISEAWCRSKRKEYNAATAMGCSPSLNFSQLPNPLPRKIIKIIESRSLGNFQSAGALPILCGVHCCSLRKSASSHKSQPAEGSRHRVQS